MGKKTRSMLRSCKKSTQQPCLTSSLKTLTTLPSRNVLPSTPPLGMKQKVLPPSTLLWKHSRSQHSLHLPWLNNLNRQPTTDQPKVVTYMEQHQLDLHQ